MPDKKVGGIKLPAKLVEHLENGNCIAVIGAGLSMPDYPGWEALVKDLLNELKKLDNEKYSKLEQGLGQRKISQLQDILDASGNDFWDVFSSVLGDKRLTGRIRDRYNNLAMTKFNGFITTNFDEQLRAGFARVGRPLDYVLS